MAIGNTIATGPSNSMRLINSFHQAWKACSVKEKGRMGPPRMVWWYSNVRSVYNSERVLHED